MWPSRQFPVYRFVFIETDCSNQRCSHLTCNRQDHYNLRVFLSLAVVNHKSGVFERHNGIDSRLLPDGMIMRVFAVPVFFSCFFF